MVRTCAVGSSASEWKDGGVLSEMGGLFLGGEPALAASNLTNRAPIGLAVGHRATQGGRNRPVAGGAAGRGTGSPSTNDQVADGWETAFGARISTNERGSSPQFGDQTQRFGARVGAKAATTTATPRVNKAAAGARGPSRRPHVTVCSGGW